MKTSTTLYQPQQKRSQESLERLLAASQDLISAGNFEDATIQDITRLADYSVGAFYSRFPSKEALFKVVQQNVSKNTSQWVGEELLAYRARIIKSKEPPSLQDCVDFCVGLIYRMYSSNPGMYRAIFLHTRLKGDAEKMAGVKKFNTERVDESIEILKLAKNVKVDEALIDRWKMGLGLVTAYLREVVLFGDPVPSAQKAKSEKLIQASRDMFLSYLLTTSEE